MVTTQDVLNAIDSRHQDKGSRIDVLIPLVEGHIRNYCGITEIPADYDLNIILMVEYHLNNKAGLTNESLSRLSQGFSNDYPANVLKGLRRKLVW